MDIKIRERTYRDEDNSFSPELSYLITEDTKIYSDKDKKSAVDKLDKGSIVKMIDPSDKDFALVDYNGNIGFVEKDVLKDF
ncbi:hypothetical protein [Anaerococcus tetradius]|jgi:hypothetical protein|uniref:SH3 domain protein n=1 Tax=Anaerococcus tetradius ATCC 35098 TaxID=525255 RepID=C2CIZ8_9FIRM|nr:hypothetical protein [Anaerococcus tetradius]EEI82437.1 hypothetical protein HMPREF0077_1458 [Anaerococcus tetradius ATCC 35098]